MLVSISLVNSKRFQSSNENIPDDPGAGVLDPVEPDNVPDDLTNVAFPSGETVPGKPVDLSDDLAAGDIHPASERIGPAEFNKTRIYDLQEQLAAIEHNMNGTFGVFVKNLADNSTLGYNTDQYWYLASATKIPMAIAILQNAEAGELSLDDEIVLIESHFVDGAGDVLWHQPGTRFRISFLLEKMIQYSDNSATDMLFGLIGEEELNRRIRETMVPEGLGRITSILQVRLDAFSEFHENAVNLSNMDILHVNSTRCRIERLDRLMARMSVGENDLNAGSIAEAFERYYRRNINSGNLEAMGFLLERLYNGELLSEDNTRYLLNVMAGVRTGDQRIKAGLPDGFRFVHKTGTQISRTVNVGIVYPGDDKGYPLIIAASVKSDDLREAENALKEIGRIMSGVMTRQEAAL